MCLCGKYLCCGEAAPQLRCVLEIFARRIYIVLFPVKDATLAKSGAFRARLFAAQFNCFGEIDLSFW